MIRNVLAQNNNLHANSSVRLQEFVASEADVGFKRRGFETATAVGGSAGILPCKIYKTEVLRDEISGILVRLSQRVTMSYLF